MSVRLLCFALRPPVTRSAASDPQDNSKWSFMMDEQLMSWATSRPEVSVCVCVCFVLFIIVSVSSRKHVFSQALHHLTLTCSKHPALGSGSFSPVDHLCRHFLHKESKALKVLENVLSLCAPFF